MRRPEPCDEGLSFLVLGNIAQDSADRARFMAAMRERMAAVSAQPAFHRWVQQPNKTQIEHYHLVSPLRKVSREMGPLQGEW